MDAHEEGHDNDCSPATTHAVTADVPARCGGCSGCSLKSASERYTEISASELAAGALPELVREVGESAGMLHAPQ